MAKRPANLPMAKRVLARSPALNSGPELFHQKYRTRQKFRTNKTMGKNLFIQLSYHDILKTAFMAVFVTINLKFQHKSSLMKQFIKQNSLYFAFAVALGSTLGSLYFSQI